MINNIRKKRLPKNFIVFFAVTGIRADLPTEFLPSTNRETNHHATYTYTYGFRVF